MKNSSDHLLDIIVPHYHEPWSTIEKFFTILDLQRGVSFSSFRVILVNDGEENALPEEHFSSREYDVWQMSIPHAGVSAARNHGLKSATAPWVMFCDCDDMFFHPFALMDILNVLPNDKADLLWTDYFTEANRKFNATVIMKTGFDAVFVHGKLYRRQFLLDHNIFFDEEISYCEDSLFNTTAWTIADEKRTGHIATQCPTYVWCDTDGSVTNTYKTRDIAPVSVFHRNKKVCDLYHRLRPYDQYCAMIARTIIDAYYVLNLSVLTDKLKALKKDVRTFYIEHKAQYEAVPYETLKLIKEKSKKCVFPNDMPIIENVSVTQWLKRLESESEKEEL